MKKFIITLLFIAGTFGLINVNAQTKPVAKKAVTTAKVKDPAAAKKSGLKKDGTPDMRMKENKAAAKTAPATTTGPLKKDGTPDMRYKANKKKS
jgi:hypothetical protein